MTINRDLLSPARVLVTGSVDWTNHTAIEQLLTTYAARQQSTGGSFRILTGMATGADAIARSWADANNVALRAEPLEPGEYPLPMHHYNERMLSWQPELVLAFKDPFDPRWQSPDCAAGTEHMCRRAAHHHIPTLLNGSNWLTPPVTTPRRPKVTSQQPCETRIGATTVHVVLGDITTITTNVVVNAANSSLLGGGGVDGAIHRAAGPDLLAECRRVVARQGGCATGHAVLTGAGRLSASYVVHTVGPVWTGDAPERHDALLAQCYTESLQLAATAGATSIAFPNISTGVYRFPSARAAQVAYGAVTTWLRTQQHDLQQVIFVCFGRDNFDLYTDLVSPSGQRSDLSSN